MSSRPNRPVSYEDIDKFNAPAGIVFSEQFPHFHVQPTTSVYKYAGIRKDRIDANVQPSDHLKQHSPVNNAMTVLWNDIRRLKEHVLRQAVFQEMHSGLPSIVDYGYQIARGDKRAVFRYDTPTDTTFLHYEDLEVEGLMEYELSSGLWHSYMTRRQCIGREIKVTDTVIAKNGRDRINIPSRKEDAVAQRIRKLEASLYASYTDIIEPNHLDDFLKMEV
ncbi:MAG: hypothetical protein PHZ00_00920 [Candidatus Peribacteraceae bacterium]|nr:hypothetical protein [Candidatus Peribacteraceae bacterium]